MPPVARSTPAGRAAARAHGIALPSADEQASARRDRNAVALMHAARSDAGPVRPCNEDRWQALDGLRFYVIADGMGGDSAGEVAAELAVATACRSITAAAGDPAVLLAAVAADCNARIRGYAADHPDCLGMGSTLAACLIAAGGDRVHLAHVGDSRIYRLRNGALERLTRDHSIGQQIADGRRLSEARIRQLAARGILTRALGVGPAVDAEIATLDWCPADTLLLCTDGLTDPLPDAVIGTVLTAHAAGGPAAQADALVVAALEAGAADNLTALVVRACGADAVH
ncbi:MAG: PP2C family serine/threonine-protein phosphatase [Lautropia sp.]